MKPNSTPLKFFVLLLMLILPAAIPAQDIEFAILPFNRVGNLIYVEAIVDEQSGFFLIDTGYRGVLLNKTFYDGMPTDLHLQGSNGIGGRLEYKNVDLRLGLLNVENVDANVADLTKLSQTIGMPLHGMIGSTFFQDFELLIDYRNNNVVLIKLDRHGEKMVELPTFVSPTDTLPFHFKGHLPVITVSVGDRELHLGIDTGAAANLFRSDNWSKLEEYVWDEREQFLRGLGKMRKKIKSGMLSQVQFEDIPFRSMRTLFGNIGHINRDLAGPSLDGIVGYEFLHQYTMAFNYRKRELYLWRVEPVEDSAEVDYTADNRDE